MSHLDIHLIHVTRTHGILISDVQLRHMHLIILIQSINLGQRDRGERGVGLINGTIHRKKVAWKTTVDSSHMAPREAGTVYELNKQTNDTEFSVISDGLLNDGDQKVGLRSTLFGRPPKRADD